MDRECLKKALKGQYATFKPIIFLNYWLDFLHLILNLKLRMPNKIEGKTLLILFHCGSPIGGMMPRVDLFKTKVSFPTCISQKKRKRYVSLKYRAIGRIFTGFLYRNLIFFS